MPTYEYVCTKCGKEFIRVMSFKEYATAQVACPGCNSSEVKQQLSHFVAQTSRKS